MPHGIRDGYICNPINSRDSEDNPYWKKNIRIDGWQIPAYKFVSRNLRGPSQGVIAELGCGTGVKGNRFLARKNFSYVGLDQESGISIARKMFPDGRFYSIDLEDEVELFRIMAEIKPQHIVCLDVLEHLSDPTSFVSRVSVSATDAVFYWSTPDRTKVPGNPPFGPPRNPLHVREWTRDELKIWLESLGHVVIAHENLSPYRHTNILRNLVRNCLVAIRNLVYWRIVGVPKYSQLIMTKLQK